MDWTHLFMPDTSSGGAEEGSADPGVETEARSRLLPRFHVLTPICLEEPLCMYRRTGLILDAHFYADVPLSLYPVEQSLFIPTSGFFESPTTPLPPRPPSIPADLDPAPLFSPCLDSTTVQDASATRLPFSYTSAVSESQLGLAQLPSTLPSSLTEQQQQQPQFRQTLSSASPLSLSYPQPAFSGPLGALPPSAKTLFDSGEEAYLNSFLSSFDPDGLDIGAFFASSPQPAANFSARVDLASMDMGMGIGAGMMGAIDDVIPHITLDDGTHDSAHDLSRMITSATARGIYTDTGDSMGSSHRHSLFDYGLGGTSHLSLGNVMSEEMQKVSSWLMHSQDHQVLGLPNYPTPLGLTSPITGSAQPFAGSARILTSPFAQALHPPNSAGANEAPVDFVQFPKPSSEADFSIKRKASYEQLGQPRKTRENLRPSICEAPTLFSPGAIAIPNDHGAVQGISLHTPTTPVALHISTSAEPMPAGGASRRRDSKKAAPRTPLTEGERRANHIASEQRRRNQIRNGYSELMNLVTTLRDPALGNHPGTAQSTPSKAVILTHAVQFIRDLEEGNRLLRKRIDGAHHELPQARLLSQSLAVLQPHSPSPPQY
ncbi:hypothetical protein H4S08_004332 [Coemansia sp. RSA 1365]|nr:hypothetical protein H4S08_004332 [Coemansia sp. RSA 1365]